MKRKTYLIVLCILLTFGLLIPLTFCSIKDSKDQKEIADKLKSKDKKETLNTIRLISKEEIIRNIQIVIELLHERDFILDHKLTIRRKKEGCTYKEVYRRICDVALTRLLENNEIRKTVTRNNIQFEKVKQKTDFKLSTECKKYYYYDNDLISDAYSILKNNPVGRISNMGEKSIVYSADLDTMWGEQKNNLICGISFPKKVYTVGEPIYGTLYLKNLSRHTVTILKPLKLGRWGLKIEGPAGGDYEWKGGKYKIAPVTRKDFIPLKKGSVYRDTIHTALFLIQYSSTKGKGIFSSDEGWQSVLPGKYTIQLFLQMCVNSPPIFQLKSGKMTIEVINKRKEL